MSYGIEGAVGLSAGVGVDFCSVVEDKTVSQVTPDVKIENLTVESILSQFKSGIGLDIAKNHTGVCLWRDGKVETLGFAVEMEYDNTCYMAEAKMRLWFKNKLKELLQGYDWEVCVVEDVYGGVNFDTTRKLLALNCVIDELMLEGSVSIGNLYRFKESEWIKDLRTIVKLGNKLNPKYECQEILNYLNFDFVRTNRTERPSYQSSIFFEDRCDATGQLLALAMHLNSELRTVKQSSLRLSNINMFFVEDLEDIYYLRDEVINSFELVEVCNFNKRNIEQGILDTVRDAGNQVSFVELQTGELGTFGLKNGFEFYSQGYGYLVFYDKALRKL